MCLYSRLIKNKKYTANKKNGGVIPAVYDRRTEYVPVKCGNCMECRKQKKREWQLRLGEDIRTNKNGKFITLTMSNESIVEIMKESIRRTDKKTGEIRKIKIEELKGYDRDNMIATRAMRLFNERWRKKYKKAIRHWMITEIGHNGTENMHMHGIMWTDESFDEIRRIWGYGYIYPRPDQQKINYVSEKTVNYMVKYISKMDKQHKEYKPVILTSSGIGGDYTKTTRAEENEYKKKETIETYRTSTGHKMSMPIYWRNKLYTEGEREELWIDKLNKEERWVCGEKVSIKEGQERYEKLVEWYRKRNKELGYGGVSNENRKEYEEARREIMIMTRIRKASPAGRKT